jgi:hypothetical protein
VTLLLRKAMKRAAALSKKKQDGLGSIILAESDSGRRWGGPFAKTRELLSEPAA